jgi:hypothetical protein
MGWGNEQTKLGVDEAAAGAGADGDWVTLGAGGKSHYTVVRNDAAPGDRWFLDIISSVNASRVDDPPYERFVLASDELVKSFVVTGVFSFRVHIENAESAGTDVLETDHYWKLDGVDL